MSEERDGGEGLGGGADGDRRAEERGLLRSDREVALSELVEALTRAAGLEAQAAERLGDQSAAGPLHALAELRQADRDALLAAGVAAGEVPSEPDPDRVAAEGLLQTLRAALSPDETETALRECREAEARLAEALAAARAHDHRAAVLEALDRLAAQEGEAARHLDAAAAATRE